MARHSGFAESDHRSQTVSATAPGVVRDLVQVPQYPTETRFRFADALSCRIRHASATAGVSSSGTLEKLVMVTSPVGNDAVIRSSPPMDSM